MFDHGNGIIEYTIEHGNMRLSVLNLGAVITNLSYKNQNIVAKFKDYQSYLNNSTYLGGIIGRSAGRIRNGKVGDFTIPINFKEKHNLHGNNLHLKFYDVDASGNKIICTLDDPAGDFPGNAKITVTYTLLADRLVQEFSGVSDEPTVFNMTNHTYFNLSSNKSILKHKLQIQANDVCELDEDLLPIGTIPTKGTAFDFNNYRLIEESYQQGHSQFQFSKFIDHPFKINGQVKLCCDNLQLEVVTDQPYVVTYAGNYVGDETNEFDNLENKDYSAICLETQDCPNTVNFVTDYYAKTEYILSEI